MLGEQILMEPKRAFGRNGGSNSLNSGRNRFAGFKYQPKHKALRSYAYELGFKQYSCFSLMIIPKENQSLEEAEQLLLAEIEKSENGDFPDWLIPAIINDMKLQKSEIWKLQMV